MQEGRPIDRYGSYLMKTFEFVHFVACYFGLAPQMNILGKCIITSQNIKQLLEWSAFLTWWWWSWFCQRQPGSSPGSGSRRCRASWRGCRGEGPRWWPSPGCSWSFCKALGRGTWCPMPPHTSCWRDLGPALAACWPGRFWTAWTPSTLLARGRRRLKICHLAFNVSEQRRFMFKQLTANLRWPMQLDRTWESRSLGYSCSVLRYWCCILGIQLFGEKHLKVKLLSF